MITPNQHDELTSFLGCEELSRKTSLVDMSDFWGSTRLSDSVKLGPSASKTKTITMSGSSVGSSSEVNSLVSFAATENTQKKLEEFDVEVTVDKSHDSQRDFATKSSGISKSIHQLCVIIIEAAE
jgi:hypothetical protein